MLDPFIFVVGKHSMYQLYYWPGLPGRGEFIRLVLEHAKVAYEDIGLRQGFEPIVAMKQTIAGFAPPYFVHGETTLAQMPAICMYLGQRHGLCPADHGDSTRVLQLLLTISDTLSEIHDLHHPLSIAKTYEQQKDAALQCAQEFHQNRLQQWITFYSKLLIEQNWLVRNNLSVADLALFQLVSGIEYAFPTAFIKLISPELLQHQAHTRRLQPLKNYLNSSRRQPFNETGIFRHYKELDLA
jgi:glutathione S-transferase